MKLNTGAPLKRSFWMEQEEPNVRAENILSGKVKADVAIIGGGYVGLWTALSIKESEPDCRVVILEQDVCGGGASGRNGGLVMSWWPKIQSLMSFSSKEEAKFLCAATERSVSEIGEFCQRHSIDAEFRQSGWFWTATCEAHINAWEGTLKICDSLGVAPFERISRYDISQLTGSKRYLSAVFERSNATVQPAALARGLRRAAIEAGIDIMEGSPVKEIHSGTPVELMTQNGQVSADKVVVATNAWSSSIPELRKKMAVVSSSMIVTCPITDDVKRVGLSKGESFTDSQLMVNYWRSTYDGRIAFGKGTGSLTYASRINGTFSVNKGDIDLVKEDFKCSYPEFSGVEVASSWSGPIDRTYDSLPIFGNLGGSKNIFYGVGWSGNGVGPSRIGGKILASLSLAKNDDWSNCSLVERRSRLFPPEPFRFLGGSLVRGSVLRKDRAEVFGGKVNPLDRLLSGFAPAGLEDK